LDDSGNLNIVCNQVPIGDVQAAFNRTTATDIYRFSLTPTANTATIPSNLLSGKRTQFVTLVCPTSNYLLKIDPTAFTSSSSYTEQFFISGCDLSQTDFTFLTGFSTMTFLQLVRSTLQNLQGIPPLPSLKTIVIGSCTGFKQWSTSVTAPSLQSLSLSSNQFDDLDADRVLRSFSASSNSITVISLTNNKLTTIPDPLRIFTRLSYLSLENNNIPIISNNSLVLSAAAVEALYLTNSQLSTVQPGALQGKMLFSSIKKSFKKDMFHNFRLLWIC
jgi:Leucine-rich repeat (LRR) protein